jgi:hypothetical protein
MRGLSCHFPTKNENVTLSHTTQKYRKSSKKSKVPLSFFRGPWTLSFFWGDVVFFGDRSGFFILNGAV